MCDAYGPAPAWAERKQHGEEYEYFEIYHNGCYYFCSNGMCKEG